MRPSVSAALATVALAIALPVHLAEEPVSAGSKTARLEGTASLDRHRRVVGATVLASSGSSLHWLTSTDDKGFFALDRLPEGSYRVELRRDGLAPVVKEGINVRFPFRAVVEVTLAPATDRRVSAKREGAGTARRVRVTGTVRVRGGEPLGETRIRLVRADQVEDPRSILTSRDGTFALEDVPAGAWRVEVLGPGYLPVRMVLGLADDARIEAVLVSQPANYVAPAVDLLPQEEPIPPPAR
jgi:hypothetical protein